MTSALTNQRQVFKACLTQTEQLLLTSHVKSALWTVCTVCTVDKSKVEISQNFVANSEYTNFKRLFMQSNLKNNNVYVLRTAF